MFQSVGIIALGHDIRNLIDIIALGHDIGNLLINVKTLIYIGQLV